MIEILVALVGGAIVIGVLWWRDERARSGWEDLLDPELPEIQDLIAQKFGAEEWLARRTGDTTFVADLVPGRLQLVRRFAVYERIIAAAAEPPDRMRVRLRLLRKAFRALARPGTAGAAELATLDREALESCRRLAAVVARVGQRA